MPDPFRDDHEAALAQIEALRSESEPLREENATLREENAALRAGIAVPPRIASRRTPSLAPVFAALGAAVVAAAGGLVLVMARRPVTEMPMPVAPVAVAAPAPLEAPLPMAPAPVVLPPAPQPDPSVSPLARQQVIAAMNAVRGTLLHCTQGFHGTIHVRVVFTETGRVSDAHALAPLDGTARAGCIVQAVRTARLPPSVHAPVTLDFPYVIP